MDYKEFVPDFDAVGKTDWSKPEVDTNDTMSLLALGGAALMLIFVFLPWCTFNSDITMSVSRLGITTWYGVFGFLLALCAAAGTLYKHYTVTFAAAVCGVIFGLIGMTVVPSFTIFGQTLSGDMVKMGVEAAKAASIFGFGDSYIPTLTHTGAVLFMLASIAAGAGAFLKITKK